MHINIQLFFSLSLPYAGIQSLVRLWFLSANTLCWRVTYLILTTFSFQKEYWDDKDLALVKTSSFRIKKSCHFMTFCWRLESKRSRAREKRNLKFCALGAKYLVFVSSRFVKTRELCTVCILFEESVFIFQFVLSFKNLKINIQCGPSMTFLSIHTLFCFGRSITF